MRNPVQYVQGTVHRSSVKKKRKQTNRLTSLPRGFSGAPMIVMGGVDPEFWSDLLDPPSTSDKLVQKAKNAHLLFNLYGKRKAFYEKGVRSENL